MEESDRSEVCKILDGVRNLRGLGLQLQFPQGDLNSLDEMNFKDRRVHFFTRWRALNINCNWAALKEALLTPQINCKELANEISKKIQDHSHLIKQESRDSAVSVTSPTSASSLVSPETGSLPLGGKSTACLVPYFNYKLYLHRFHGPEMHCT